VAALQAGDVETRVQELNHALLVIAHLQNVLNFERGGEAAQQLERFYGVTRGLIVDANSQGTSKPIEELVELYGGLREAWHQADQKSTLDQAQAPASDQPVNAAGTGAASPANDTGDTPQSRWSA
jgi:flagellar protein FliS